MLVVERKGGCEARSAAVISRHPSPVAALDYSHNSGVGLRSELAIVLKTWEALVPLMYVVLIILHQLPGTAAAASKHPLSGFLRVSAFCLEAALALIK